MAQLCGFYYTIESTELIEALSVQRQRDYIALSLRVLYSTRDSCCLDAIAPTEYDNKFTSNEDPVIIKAHNSNEDPVIIKAHTSNEDPVIIKAHNSNEDPVIIKAHTSNEDPVIIKAHTSNEDPVIIKAQSFFLLNELSSR